MRSRAQHRSVKRAAGGGSFAGSAAGFHPSLIVADSSGLTSARLAVAGARLVLTPQAATPTAPNPTRGAATMIAPRTIQLPSTSVPDGLPVRAPLPSGEDILRPFADNLLSVTALIAAHEASNKSRQEPNLPTKGEPLVQHLLTTHALRKSAKR